MLCIFFYSETTKDLKPPEPRRFLFFTLNLPTSPSGNNADKVFEDMKPFFQFIFHTIDRMKRCRLSRDVRNQILLTLIKALLDKAIFMKLEG